MQAQQGEDIPDQVKRYRQSIFKLGGCLLPGCLLPACGMPCMLLAPSQCQMQLCLLKLARSPAPA
jgi:hypothetical protein